MQHDMRTISVASAIRPVPNAPFFNPLSPTAAEVIGFDCSLPVDVDMQLALRQAYLTYPVLIFRDQTLSAPELAAFGRLFGRPEAYQRRPPNAAHPRLASLHETRARATPDQILYLHPEDARVVIMTNEVLGDLPALAVIDNAECWHSDASHKSEPYQAIVVHVLQNPATGGGDTEFCDLRLMYDALSAAEKKLLAHRTAAHHWSKSLNPRFAGLLDAVAMQEGARIAAMIPPIHQPLVRTHPETGRQALYLSPRFTLSIDGVPPEASESVLNEIFGLMDLPRFCYRHQWREGDLVIWDNRCLNHRVRAYAANDIRRRHRITLCGDTPYYRAAES